MKYFHKEFNKFKEKLQNRENFAFSRFSDGELFIMQNQTVILAEDHFITGDRLGYGIYTKEEQKAFIPEQHGFFRDLLLDSYAYRKPNYYKGICTPSDQHVGVENFIWQKELYGKGDDEHLTFSNLFINDNYKRFVEEIVPMFKDRKIVYIVNELADLSGLPFKVEKDFRVGSNCMINNLDVVEKVANYLDEVDAKDYIVLCSAASLSNIVIYKCFQRFSDNTFLDVGSALNPYLSLEGWKHTRGYLTAYWLASKSPFGSQVDIWM